MSQNVPPIPCPACGTPHGSHQRYCLSCGTLVGARSIDLGRAWALARAGEAVAAAPEADAPAPRASVWRRPTASVLTTAALALGVLGGFLLGPDGGFADHGARAPLLLGGLGGPATTTTAAATTTEDDTPPADTGTTDLAPAGDGDTSTATDDSTSDGTTGDGTTGDGTTGDDTTDDLGDGSPDLSGASGSDDTTPGSDPNLGGLASATLPPIDHVWVISVAGLDRAALFGTPHGYLSDALASRGTLLANYTPVAASPLAGGSALLAGEAPSAATQAGCATYADGDCVRPASVATLAGQLTAKGKTWRAYVAGLGPAGCAHPAAGAPTDPVAARDPFVFFHAIADAPECATGVVDLDHLGADLTAEDTLPSFSYIIPTAAEDGSAPGGTAALDAFLERTVAPIRRTKAYKSGGLIAIVPATVAPGTDPATGALLLSPFAGHGKRVDIAAGPYALLRTLEELFGLDHLGHAADEDVAALGSDVLAPRD
jgi:hypothetical protein